MREVTVIIPNYNGKKYLTDCLRSLDEHSDAKIEIIVVDNHSTDGSIEEAKTVYPQVKYIVLDKNYGFSRAVNEGIRNADTPYVLLLNNDTEIQSGFVEQLLKTIKSDKRIFSVEAKMLKLDQPDRIDSAGTFYNVLGWARARGKGQPSGKYEKSCSTFAACGGAAIYRKSVFAKTGLFDEAYFAYLEDIDMGYRARLYGYRNVYEPKAVVYHAGSGTSGSKYNDFKVKISARNNVYLIYKNMPLLQIMMNLPFLAAGFAIKAVYFMKKGFGRPYLQGLKEGVKLCGMKEKLPYSSKRLLQYIKIQMRLWMVKI